LDGKVQGFQGILEGLEAEHKTEEENWFKWSQWAVFITLGLIVLVIILIACNIFESHDTYIVLLISLETLALLYCFLGFVQFSLQILFLMPLFFR
jgi:hypothetical protein